MVKNLNTVSKAKTSWFKYLLLVVCLCVLAIRATYTESINTAGANPWLNFNSDLHSLSLSTVLLAAAVLWFVYACLSRKFTYRYTGLEIGLVFFVIAGFIGLAVASDKRAAVTEFVSLLIPVLAAVMLVQILDSHAMIRLVLLVIVGLGVASAVQCAGQFFVDTNMMIDQYETDPHSILGPLGIAPGSFNQMLFEHRLYTKGVTGFLTTSNSVSSFSILAFFAALALFAEQLKKYIRQKKNILPVAAIGIAMIAVLLNLAFARSKGAIAAFILALIIFIILIFAGRWIAAHRKAVLLMCLVLAIAAGFLVVSYGKNHSRLPGGNSMLVRWQYWTGAARMYAAHPLTGVGPGNFDTHYTQYKAPAALEAVKDPHNFLLSLLTQYGPLGLIGFLLMLLLPWHSTLKNLTPHQCAPKKTDLLSRRVLLTFVVAITAVLLLIRPVLKPIAASGEPLEAVLYVMFTIFFVPVAAFVAGIWLACGLFREEHFTATNLTFAALICATVGVVVHNLIDFAIFEMGIYTALWAVIAAMIALHKLHQPNAKLLRISRLGRAAVLVLLAVTVVAFFTYSLIPVATSTSNTARSYRAYKAGLTDRTQYFLTAAANADPLNPVPCTVKGRLALREYHNYAIHRADRLILAEKSYLQALQRDAIDFAGYERLAKIYELLSDNDKSGETKWLNKALNASRQAVRLYPGLGRLTFQLAKIAESLGKDSFAVENYKKAVEIEDAYRRQFRIMYPGREIFSRLGRENYDFAKRRITALKSD